MNIRTNMEFTLLCELHIFLFVKSRGLGARLHYKFDEFLRINTYYIFIAYKILVWYDI